MKTNIVYFKFSCLYCGQHMECEPRLADGPSKSGLLRVKNDRSQTSIRPQNNRWSLATPFGSLGCSCQARLPRLRATWVASERGFDHNLGHGFALDQ